MHAVHCQGAISSSNFANKYNYRYIHHSLVSKELIGRLIDWLIDLFLVEKTQIYIFELQIDFTLKYCLYRFLTLPWWKHTCPLSMSHKTGTCTSLKNIVLTQSFNLSCSNRNLRHKHVPLCLPKSKSLQRNAQIKKLGFFQVKEITPKGLTHKE